MKRRIEELAIVGGTPAFDDKVLVGRPNLPDLACLNASVAAILNRRWLTNDGPCVRDLERRLEILLDVRHCVATCNGTTALQMAARATGLTGDVIIPSFTFVAVPHALSWIGLRPVFCDVAAETHNLDPERVRAAITPQTSGILGVHCWGRPCDIDRLTEIAREFDVTLLFDAAHAFGCSYRGRMIGGFGRAEIFSFHATKCFHTLEGGAVMTNDDDLAVRLRAMRNFGLAATDRVVGLGINAKMNEVNAAVGLCLLETLDATIAANHRHAAHYERELAGMAGLRLVRNRDEDASNDQYAVIEIEPDAAGLTRDELIEVLQAENVVARRYLHPGCHRVPPYGSTADHDPALQNTETLTERVLCLPTGTALESDDIQAVCGIIRLALANGLAIRQRLRFSTSVAGH